MTGFVKDVTGHSGKGVLRDMPRRAGCPVCKRRFAVTPTSGVIRKHYVKPGPEALGPPVTGERVVCSGSGRSA
jgi:hypothetical protein